MKGELIGLSPIFRRSGTINKNKKIYHFDVSFTQSVTGEALGVSEEEIRAGLVTEFATAPNFVINSITELGDYSQLELEGIDTIQ